MRGGVACAVETRQWHAVRRADGTWSGTSDGEAVIVRCTLPSAHEGDHVFPMPPEWEGAARSGGGLKGALREVRRKIG